MTEPNVDPDALIREYFARPEVAARTTAELLAARKAAERPEPPLATAVPAPEFPTFGIARYHCPRQCGWWHDEPTDPGPSALIISADQAGADVGTMLSLNAKARLLALHGRVERAIGEHYAAAH
ncbi:hypothetical protein ACFYXM_08795 [Streptomyces sp. NPDC002476]|uniref:hypothetical protein n=1 Tax=Streptomyces sp. NPDC002476 TaxID=3364648 RepID=UPI00368B9C48